MIHYVYILYSENIDKYYIGSSHDPEMRLNYHNRSKKGWTKRGIPWKIVYEQGFSDKTTAMDKEKYIKRQKSREYIEKLISGKYSI